MHVCWHKIKVIKDWRAPKGEIMATVEELVKQYETDEALQKEVADIVADGKITMMEFVSFAKKHNVKVSLEELPKYTEQARKLGFIK